MGPGLVSREWASGPRRWRSRPPCFNGARPREPGVGRHVPRGRGVVFASMGPGLVSREWGRRRALPRRGDGASMGPGLVSREWDGGPSEEHRQRVHASMGPGLVSREWVVCAAESRRETLASMGPGLVSREWASPTRMTRRSLPCFNGARPREPGVGGWGRWRTRCRSPSFNGARPREPGVGAEDGEKAGDAIELQWGPAS